MSDKKQENIALFRYGIIAPVLNETRRCKMKHFREKSKIEFDVPEVGKKRYKPATFKSWLRDYKTGGFDALKPKPRVDKGSSRKVDEVLGEIIKDKTQEHPFLSASGIYKLLITDGKMDPAFISEGTIRKYIKDNRLKINVPQSVPRKKFEKEHINELWIADCMYGPYILQEGKKRKTFLIDIIDDCSRVIVGARFFFHENSINLETLLKDALLRFGAPDVLYTDNGAIFITSHLQLACARLGIGLVHSKPYDSPSRGKIERFHRTVRDKFLPFVDIKEIDSLDTFNMSFSQWLDKEYQKSYHHGINAKPMDKWIDNLKERPIRRVSANELEQAFYITIKRKVKNDSTISVNNILYEVPHHFIGKILQLRYPSDRPNNLTIYEKDEPVCKVKKVNPIENANPPAWEINFHKKGKNHD